MYNYKEDILRYLDQYATLGMKEIYVQPIEYENICSLLHKYNPEFIMYKNLSIVKL